MVKHKKNQGGFFLVEILVSIGVFAAIIFAAVGVFIISQELVQIARTKTKGVYHLKDYVEKIKNTKRFDWSTLVNGRYLYIDNAGNWELQTTTTGEVVGAYTKYIDIASGRRDATGTLVPSGGTIDPSTKLITITVSWTGIKAGSLTESFYITRYLDNLPWELTTEADFDAGTHSGTTVTNDAGGEVVLGAGGGASWCAPSLVIAGLDLPKSGVANAVTAIEGRAFAGTGNNSSGESFVNVNITNTDPPVGAILGVMDGYKTNDVFGETNYGYIATDTNSKEMSIISIASTPYSESGFFNAPGSTDANSIFVYGTTAYVATADNKLYNVDVTSKTGSRTAYDATGVTLNGTGTAVVVSGDYAYVATSSVDHQLQIVNLASPTNLTVLSSVNLNATGATDLFVNSSATRAYIVTSSSATPGQAEFFIINIENKSAPTLVSGGTYDTNGMSPRGVEVVPGGKAIIVGTSGIEYQVISVSNESALASCVATGGLNVDSGIYDSASVLEADNDAYTYIVTGDTNAELRIIEGGPGGEFATSGVWESATFDADHSAAFNRFEANFDEPGQTNIYFQVAIVDPGASGTCTDADFSSTNFLIVQDGAAVPIDDTGANYENPGRCARVRAYLETTDFSQTPTLQDITINYSP